MKKFLVPAMIVLASVATVNAHAAKPSDNLSRHALGEAKDTRSAWAKSQDMYIEPTLRMTETTVPVSPDQARQQDLNVQAVPPGSVPPGGATQTTVIGPNGQPVQQAAPTHNMPGHTMPAPTGAAPAPVATPPGTAPVQDLSQPRP